MPSLRPMREDDVTAVLDLNERDVHVLAPLDEPRLRQLEAWSDRLDVVDVDGEVAGFVITMPAGSAYDSPLYGWFRTHYRTEDFTYLDRIVIGEAHRRRGLATLVYDTVEATAHGRVALEVNADPPNEPSLAFHHGRGFVDLEAVPWAGKTVMMMEKRL